MKAIRAYLGTIQFKSFLAGIGAALVVAVVLGIFVENDEWQIKEVGAGRLKYVGFDHEGTLIHIDIEYEPDSHIFESCKFFKLPGEKGGLAFTYRADGKYGVPASSYGDLPEDGRMMWYDNNADSIFDQRLVDADGTPQKQIYLDGRWLSGDGTDEFHTEEGAYIFDSNSGMWKEISLSK